MAIFGKKEETTKAKAKTSVKKTASSVKAVKKTRTEKVLSLTDRSAKVLIKPLISEKATMVNALNQYIFMVAIQANKVEIKKAIEELYQVVPVRVNIIRQSGKQVRAGRGFGSRKQTKKAIVTLRKGETIKLYEGI